MNGDAGPHFLRRLQHGHIAKPGARLPADENMVVTGFPGHAGEDFEGARGERYAMNTPAFHPLCGDRPDLRLDVNFAPPGAYGLNCTGRVQDRSFKRERRHAAPLAKLAHKAGNVRIGERRLMADLANRGARRKG